MRLLIFLFLFITITVCSHAQPGDLVEITKKWPRKDILVTDGMIYKYTLPTDSARYFNPGADAYEVTITFKKAGGTPIDIIDSTTVDSEEGVIFSTGWLHGSTTAAGWYKGTIAYSITAASTASYTFTGRQVKIYAERLPGHGTGTVSILKGTQVIVNEAPVSFKSTVKQLPVLVYSSPVLADDTYTVRLKAPGGAPTMLDFFRFFKKR